MRKKLLTSCMMLGVASILLMQPSYAISVDSKPIDSTVAQSKSDPESAIVGNAMDAQLLCLNQVPAPLAARKPFERVTSRSVG